MSDEHRIRKKNGRIFLKLRTEEELEEDETEQKGTNEDVDDFIERQIGKNMNKQKKLKFKRTKEWIKK